MAASHLSREAFACAPFAGPTMLALKDPKLRHRLTIALDADKELLPQRLLALLAPVEAEADRAFIAHNLCSLYRQLSWILHRHDRIGMAASTEMRVPFLRTKCSILPSICLGAPPFTERSINGW